MSHRMAPLAAALFCLTTAAAFAADPRKPTPAPKRAEQPSRISSNVDAQPGAALSDEEAREVSFAGGRILKHVVQARDAIREKNADEAASHVEQGLKLIAIIDGVLPRSNVKTEIKSGELTYSDEEDVTPRYVTLFDELERRDIISPIMQAQKESQRSPQKGGATQAAPKEAPGALAISHADIAYSTVKLDLVLARQMLGLAKQNLENDKMAEADEALLALQSAGVLFEFEEIDLPLEEAADNLKLAEIEMQQGRHDEAKAALHVAIDQLKEYEKLVGESQGAEVKALHQEIAKLAAELAKGDVSQADRQKHAARISEWWQRATKWFKRKPK